MDPTPLPPADRTRHDLGHAAYADDPGRSDAPPDPAPVATAAARVLVALAGVAAGLLAAAVAAFAGLIEWSGCFLSCDEPDRPLGALLLTLALASLVAGGGGAWWAARTQASRVRAAAWVVSGLMGAWAAATALTTGVRAWVNVTCSGTAAATLSCRPDPEVGYGAAALGAAVLLLAGLQARRVLRAGRR